LLTSCGLDALFFIKIFTFGIQLTAPVALLGLVMREWRGCMWRGLCSANPQGHTARMQFKQAVGDGSRHALMYEYGLGQPGAALT
jgi:hypothetical protein